MEERAQKILSQWGIASRRQAEATIRAGRVRVNGRTIALGDKIDPDRDRVEVDGKLASPSARPKPLYLLLNKPRGAICTCRDPQGRRTVLDLLPASLSQGQGLHPVGRLDVDSSGALLLVNDGALTLRLTHPRYHLPKTYRVWVAGRPSSRDLARWRVGGMLLDGKPTLPARVRQLKQEAENTLLEITLTEGRNRQIRRLAEQLGLTVTALHRTAIAGIGLREPDGEPLPRGRYRSLSPDEIRDLRAAIELD